MEAVTTLADRQREYDQARDTRDAAGFVYTSELNGERREGLRYHERFVVQRQR
ncbi:hypothetical protein PI125_g15345 [Phytophthora idaei]|nr:hypothetical protein PI125_g15345 [Phytophthora idaei]